ncbi:MAG: serine hydrolase domain-containing protein [Hyphomonadaceae bacterium]|nr:serine hydrolase domain-containing protein [Hyphomonadaceae bacterium]
MFTQGSVAPGFEPVAEAFALNFEDGAELGAGFAATLEGETIVDLWGGYADREKTRLWDADTLTPVYSTTKAIAALVIARLVDQGVLDYEAPVAEVWPEFGANGKADITLAQALSHRAGLVGFREPIDPALWLDPPGLAAALAPLAPLWADRAQSGYHPLTWGYIAGEVVARAAGKSLGQILADDFCEPHGVDFWIGLPDEEHARCAEIQKPRTAPALGEVTELKRIAFLTKWSAPDRGGALWRRIEIPSANGHGTALSVAMLYGVFANGGALNGETLIGADAFQALTRVRVDNDDLILPARVQFGAGPMRNARGVYGPNPNTIAHSGWGGSMGLGDPDRRLSCAYVMNRQDHHLQGDPRAQRLIEALYRCL